MTSTQALQAVFAVLTMGALAATAWGYPRRYGALSGRSRLFRTVGMGLLDLLLLTATAFVFTDWRAQLLQVGMTPHRAGQLVAASQALYSLTWLLLCVLLVGMALLDSLETFSVYRRERRAAFEDVFMKNGTSNVKSNVTSLAQTGSPERGAE